MSYLIRSPDADHINLLSCTLNHWAKDDEDIYFISLEGHRIFSSQRLIGFYSPVLAPLLMETLIHCPGVYLPFSSTNITALISLLSKGSTYSLSSQVSEVKSVANCLGISLNCSLDPLDKGNITFYNLASKKTGKRKGSFAVPSLQNKELMEETLEETATSSQEEIWCVDGICSTNIIDRLVYDKHMNMKPAETKEVSTKEVKNLENVAEPGQHESSLTCDKCGKSFVDIKKLRSHKYKHTATGKEKCEVCGKYLKYKTTLKRHMKIHLDLPFKCEHCDKEFSKKCNMMAHIIGCNVERSPKVDID